jgi:hypothetical protein
LFFSERPFSRAHCVKQKTKNGTVGLKNEAKRVWHTVLVRYGIFEDE